MFIKRRLMLGAISLFRPASLISFLYTPASLAEDSKTQNRSPIRIAIGKFSGDPTGENEVSALIVADLQRSGLFRVIPSNDLVKETGTVDDAFWRSKGADAVLGGTLSRADGRIEIRYRLHDTAKGVTLTSSGLKANPQFIRLAAHRVADDIFERLTGIRGPFASRIAYVAHSGNEYRLEIADSDGENAFVAFRGSEPVISPAWSPDGAKVAYVSFGLKKPVVYVQDLATRQRIAVANFKGSNSAPAWSPDGRRLALALARDGLTQIHTVNQDGTGLHRLGPLDFNCTEPCYSPDGNFIYFTSDMDGVLQIYKMDIDGSNVHKLRLGGRYNISPVTSPDGKYLAFVAYRSGKFQIHVLDIASERVFQLTDGPNDESPSFAPNSYYIMYASDSMTHPSLKITAVDGGSSHKLNSKAPKTVEPAWGPFAR